MAPDVNKTRWQHMAESPTPQEHLTSSKQLSVESSENYKRSKISDRDAEWQQIQQEMKLNQKRFETLRHLTQMIHEPEQRILDFALEAGLQATNSRIGYIYFVNKDETEMSLHAWSRSVMAQCQVENYPEAYKVDETGLWGEAIRRRRPIITNDYPSNPLRRELPEGHVPLQRHMNLPLFDGGRIVLLAGVGNKGLAYTEQDVQQLSLVMEGMWNIIKRKRAEKALHQANLALEARVQERTQALQQANKDLEHYKGIIASTPDLVALIDRDYVYCTVNDSYLSSFGTVLEEIIGKKVADLLGIDEFERYIKPHLVQAFKGETVRYERWITFPVTGRRFYDITFHPVHEKKGFIGHVAANIRDITEARLAMDDRQRIFEASFDLMCVIGFDGCIKDLNRSWTRTLGWSIEELQDKPWLELVHPEDRTNAIETEERLLLGQQTTTSEKRLRCKDGRYRWVSWNSSADRDRQEIFAIARDITDSKLLQEALKSSVRKYRTFFDSAGDAVFVHDYSGRLLDVNRVACERLGYNREELLRMPAEQLKVTQTAVRSAKLLKKIDQNGQASFEARHRSKGDDELLVWTNSRRIEYDGLPAILSICRDISERKRMENKLRNLAITDPLTGAKNRRYFINRGKEELARSLRYGTPLCVLLLDIDHFKQVNDTHGHDGGDEVLKSLTQKAQMVLRETDIFARFGGEEFAALLVQTSQQDALLTAERLRIAIEEMSLSQISSTFSITVSIGVVLFDDSDGSIEELIKRADQAMYRAKEGGRNCIVLY